ncbi:norbelladine synthase-like [Salvia splendens]|uniref:norbelladine synthase-like n=1 Tax=Salvia splendens TaxID=180675 RepID=UPI001C25D6CB|nr:norbelladine synthase-like [Salvia splendens]
MGGGMKSFKEKFVVVDNEKCVKEAEVVEGGFMGLGFTLYRMRFQFDEVGGKREACITRSPIEYALTEESAANGAIASIKPYIGLCFSAGRWIQTYVLDPFSFEQQLDQQPDCALSSSMINLACCALSDGLISRLDQLASSQSTCDG